SSTGTLQLSAQASDANGNPVTIGNDPTAFTWFSGDSSIATVDTNGLATAVNPGASNIYVRLLNQTSSPYPFTTCGVKSISAHVSGATDTSFTADASTTKALAADVVDTKGKTITITGARLIWSSNVSGIVTVDQTGSATTVGAGRAGIVVSCTPPNCNSGLTSVFSNVVTANVNGTTTSQVLAANSNSTTMIPIDTSTNTAGTAITLPFNPNSLVYAKSGTKAFLGSASNLIVYDATAGSVTSFSFLAGTVQAVSNNAHYVIVYDSTLGTVSNYDSNANGIVDRFTVAGIPSPCKTATFDKCPHASFSADNRTAYIVAGGNLYVSASGVSLKTIPLGATGNDVAFSAQSSFAFVGNSDSTVVPYASCNNAKVSTAVVTTLGVPLRVLSSTDGTAIYAVAPPNLNTIAPSTDGVGCVPSLTDPLTTVDLGQGAFNVGQMLASTKGDRLYFLTGGNNIVLYDVATNAGGAITLSGGANGLSAGLTADGNNLYVGGSDNNIHRIDTTTNTDAAQISVSFTPDLVAVRPK
ncbi:MAG: YncE family protein, partial [Limisphaerales bacterium]